MYRRTYRRRRYAKRASRYGRRFKRTAGINLRNKSGITAAAKLPSSNTRTIAIVKESNNFVMQMGVKAPNVSNYFTLGCVGGFSLSPNFANNGSV